MTKFATPIVIKQVFSFSASVGDQVTLQYNGQVVTGVIVEQYRGGDITVKVGETTLPRMQANKLLTVAYKLKAGKAQGNVVAK